MADMDKAKVISEVFRISGIRLTDDDPILAVLLLQLTSTQESLSAMEERQSLERQAFIADLAGHMESINRDAAELRGYKAAILSDIQAHADRLQSEVEDKIVASVSGRITAELGKVNHLLLTLKRYLFTATVVWALLLLVAVFILKL